MSPWLLVPFALFLVILPFPGTVAARLLLLASCFGIAVWQWAQNREARASIPCKPALGAWVIIGVLSLAYAVDPAYTLGELKNELGYTMMAFFAFFVVAGERRNAMWLLWAAGAGLVVIGAAAVAAWVAHGRVWQESGAHGGIGVFGTYVITVLPAVAWLVAEGGTATARRLAMALCGFVIFLAAIVAQRAVWPVLAVQAGLILIVAIRQRRLRIGWFGFAGVATAIAVLAFAGMLHSQHTRFGAGQVSMSTDVRLAFWPKVVANIAEHPLSGAGFGRSVMKKAYPELIPADTPELWHAHNVFLNYGLQSGVPGILALAGMFGALAILFWRVASSNVAAGAAGLTLVAGVVLRNQFNDFFVRDMSLMFWALAGLFARLAVAANKGEAHTKKSMKSPSFVFSARNKSAG